MHHLYVNLRFRLGASGFFFIQGFCLATWTCLIPGVKSSLALSDGGLGLLLLGLPCGQFTGMFISPRLIKRFGSAAMSRTAGFCLPLLILPIAHAPTFASLFPLLYCFGFFMNLSNISINTQSIQIERLHHKSIMVAFHGVWSMAILLCVLMKMGLGTFGAGTNTFVLMALCLCQILWWLSMGAIIPRELKHTLRQQAAIAEASKKKSGLKDRIKAINGSLFILGLAGFGCLACESGIINWIAVYYSSVLKLDSQWMLAGYLCFMLSVTCCRFAADLVVRRAGPFAVVMGAGWLMLLGPLLITLAPGPLISTLGCFITGFGTAPVMPIAYSLAGKAKGVSPQGAIAVVASISFMGLLFGPPLIGFISQASSLRLALAGAGIFAFLSSQTIIFARRGRC